MADDEQSLEEMAAHYGPEGPVAAANDFMVAILKAEDLRAAWTLTDPNLRVVLAQAWLWANREHPALEGYELEEAATALASEDPQYPLWDDFEETQLGEFHRSWPGFNHHDWGAASRPRPVPPDGELVLYVKTSGRALRFEEETVVPDSLVLLLRHRGGRWRVAAFQSEEEPRPGWPPE